MALVEGGLYATNIFSPNLSQNALLPEGYPQNSPYRPLIESKLKGVQERIADALEPSIVGDLLVKIANSDGSQLRWPADDVAKMVIGAVFGHSDADRDMFLRGAANADWWSEGKNSPTE